MTTMPPPHRLPVEEHLKLNMGSETDIDEGAMKAEIREQLAYLLTCHNRQIEVMKWVLQKRTEVMEDSPFKAELLKLDVETAVTLQQQDDVFRLAMDVANILESLMEK